MTKQCALFYLTSLTPLITLRGGRWCSFRSGRARAFATCGYLHIVLVSTFRVPCASGKASLPHNSTRPYFLQGSLLHNSTLQRAVFRCFTLGYPHRNVAALQRAGLLRQKNTLVFFGLLFAAALARFYRDLLRKVFFLTTPPALATIGKGAPG